MPPKPSYVEPPPTQSDLSKFLGKQQLPRQQTLGAMSKKAGPVAAAPPVADDGNAMQVDDGAVVILSGDEEEGEEAVQAGEFPKARGRERATAHPLGYSRSEAQEASHRRCLL